MADRIVRWGVIGAGGIFKRRTLPAMGSAPHAEIIAVMDSDPRMLAELERDYGIRHCYGDAAQLLQNDLVEAVYIASPVAFHHEQALAALAAKKHLLLEKPLGLDLAQAKGIAEAAAQPGVTAGAAMVMRFHDGHRRIKEAIAAGQIGEVVSCRAQLTCWFPPMENNWRQIWAQSGGGSWMDMGIHCVDLLSFLLSDEAGHVCGFIENKTFGYSVEDSASVLLHMKRGATCYIDAYFNIPDAAAKCFLEVYGTQGSILAQGTIGQTGGGAIELTVPGHGAGYEANQQREGTQSVPLDYIQQNPYAKQIDAFSLAILNRSKPEVTMEDALGVMRVMEAAYRAAREGTVITV